MDDDKPREPEITPDGDVFGAPRKFSYPSPPTFTEEERQRYAEAREAGRRNHRQDEAAKASAVMVAVSAG
jgi:hypothetical protein